MFAGAALALIATMPFIPNRAPDPFRSPMAKEYPLRRHNPIDDMLNSRIIIHGPDPRR